MKISKVQLEGFRNFSNSNINFNKNTLIIGANDVGKSNLLHA
ncbi:AAA family ATPase, partial [Vibrio parahaemolyticus]